MDRVIFDLVRKKKELLERLLTLSIRVNLQNPDPEKVFREKDSVLKMLKMNDAALEKREMETGISAIDQEKRQYAAISSLLTTIRDNNDAKIARLEVDRKENAEERSRLERTNKITKYVHQSNHYGKHSKGKTTQKQKLVSGVM